MSQLIENHHLEPSEKWVIHARIMHVRKPAGESLMWKRPVTLLTFLTDYLSMTQQKSSFPLWKPEGCHLNKAMSPVVFRTISASPEGDG